MQNEAQLAYEDGGRSVAAIETTSGTRSGTCYGDDSTLILRIPGPSGRGWTIWADS